MKKILLIMATLLLTVISSGQDHMTFKGVEINGSLADVVDNLEKVGFKYITTENRVAALEGNFAGFNALIMAIPNRKGDVYAIMATYYEGLHSWGKAVQLFDVLENNLTKKYGKPTSTKDIGTWTDGTTPIAEGDGEWISEWTVDKGNIKLAIIATEVYQLGVTLAYADAENLKVEQQSAYDDL